MSLEEMKAIVVEYLTQAKKSKHYFNELQKAIQKKFPDASLRDVKKVCNELIAEGKITYFSTGSTTMYCLAGREGETTDKGE
ncbi:dissimilatory sulfite reductase D family protein [Thermodesulfitimonas sp.]